MIGLDRIGSDQIEDFDLVLGAHKISILGFQFDPLQIRESSTKFYGVVIVEASKVIEGEKLKMNKDKRVKL